MSFDAAFQRTVGVEGAYSNNQNDLGGATKFGIIEKVARAHGWGGKMIDFPFDRAQMIYKSDHWDALNLDQVDALSPAIAAEIFDTGVNCGASVPIPFLQRALNAFNRQGKDYPDMPVDGLFGITTAAALKAFLRIRGQLGEKVMVCALNAQQGVRYFEIGEKRQANEDFEFGWWANRVAA